MKYWLERKQHNIYILPQSSEIGHVNIIKTIRDWYFYGSSIAPALTLYSNRDGKFDIWIMSNIENKQPGFYCHLQDIKEYK